MLYVYRRAASAGARELAYGLGGRRHRAIHREIQQQVRRGDVVICWGESLPSIPDVRILNGAPILGKYEDARKLQAAGIPTVEVSRTRPIPSPPVPVVDPALALHERAKELAEEFTEATYARNVVFVAAIGELYQALDSLLSSLQRQPPTPVPAAINEWLPRLSNHIGGNDLLNPPAVPDFFVKRENLLTEYRIHSFKGRSIRAGVKAPRDRYAVNTADATMPVAHPWIRSWDGGWRIRYDGVSSKQRHRELAHAATEALGLDFGAVDIGERLDGSLIVLEVNRAPGIVDGTIDCYMKAIQEWIRGE